MSAGLGRAACLGVLTALTLAGCEVGPTYQAPRIATPTGFLEIPGGRQAPLSVPEASEADLSHWWTRFDDPELESLIARAMRSNLTLQSLASRIRASREQEVIAGAAALPHVGANAYAAHVHTGSDPLAALMGGASGMAPSSGTGQSGGSDFNLFSPGFDATWEIDVFGGTRRSVEAARATTEASVWNLRDGEVSLTAEVANDYLILRATQTRVAIVDAELKREEGTLAIIAARAKAGFVTELDVEQQRTQVANAQAELPVLEAQERAMIHALGVLLGQEPETLSAELTPAAPLPNVPASLPVGLPSDLLRRRPDVRAAERKLAAASAQIGVAVADLYPKFNLLGTATFASSQIGSLLAAKNFTALGVGYVTWPVFQAGKIRANIGASREAMEQAYLAYREAVMQALQDCEDALARYGADQRRLVALDAAVASSRAAAVLALQQYRAGLVNFLNVLSAQAALLQARDQAAQATQALATDLVSLYKALGGGWSTTDVAAAESRDRR